MVTEAGKELLRNSINTANFHNKILEQNEMWKQWEIERGLTMMVSDDDILKKIRKNHRCSKHQKLAESQERSRSDMNSDAVAGTSSAERWDHNGFKELYPDEPRDKRPSVSSSSLKEPFRKWGHSGFHKLYPDELSRERSSSASSSSRGVSKKCDIESSSDEDDERQLASSSGKKCKRKSNHCSYEQKYRKERINRASLSFPPNEFTMKSDLEFFPKSLQERLSLLTEKKKCKGKCCRCQERLSSNKEEKFLMSYLKYKKLLNNYSYEEQYHNELRSVSYSPKPKKHAKRSSLSRSESVTKWDHDGYLELYPEERRKKKSSKKRV